MVSRLALTAALAAGLCLNGGYLRGVVRTHHAENLAAYQFFVRTIEAGLADAVQSDDLILCNENVWDSNAEAESAFFSRFTGRALHAQVAGPRTPPPTATPTPTRPTATTAATIWRGAADCKAPTVT